MLLRTASRTSLAGVAFWCAYGGCRLSSGGAEAAMWLVCCGIAAASAFLVGHEPVGMPGDRPAAFSAAVPSTCDAGRIATPAAGGGVGDEPLLELGTSAEHGAIVRCDARLGIVVVGTGAVARSLASALVLQMAARAPHAGEVRVVGVFDPCGLRVPDGVRHRAVGARDGVMVATLVGADGRMRAAVALMPSDDRAWSAETIVLVDAAGVIVRGLGRLCTVALPPAELCCESGADPWHRCDAGARHAAISG